MSEPKQIIFINSHPIQYFAPLYRYLCSNGLQVQCWYCSYETVSGHIDKQFSTQVQWDVPLLEGYKYLFFANRSFRPSLYHGFFGLFNPGMIVQLFKEKKSVVVVHGWAYLTHLLVIFFGKLAGHTMCLRGESPYHQEALRPPSVKRLKKLFLGKILFKFIDWFLYIGDQNKRFYEWLGVDAKFLCWAPYAVDNARFQKEAKIWKSDLVRLKQQLGLPLEKKVILYSAKYISKKRPLDLIQAFHLMQDDNTCLVMVGEGELRKQMEQYVKNHGIKNVFLTGFVNQSTIPKYYAVADVFVLCSGIGETWGLSVNEAMNFDIPVVVSDISGCATDLIQTGKNGFIFQTSNVASLVQGIQQALDMGKIDNVEVMDRYSFRTIAKSLLSVSR